MLPVTKKSSLIKQLNNITADILIVDYFYQHMSVLSKLEGDKLSESGRTNHMDPRRGPKGSQQCNGDSLTPEMEIGVSEAPQ